MITDSRPSFMKAIIFNTRHHVQLPSLPHTPKAKTPHRFCQNLLTDAITSLSSLLYISQRFNFLLVCSSLNLLASPFLFHLQDSAMAYLGSFLALLFLVFLKWRLASSSALSLNFRNHHYYSHHHHRPMLIQANGSTCALFVGTWVRDETYPLYQSSNCPIIDPEFNCQMYGRPDSDYLKYRWRPLDCELPRYLNN